MGVYGDIRRKSIFEMGKGVFELLRNIKMEETEEDRLMKELRRIENEIGNLVMKELMVVRKKQGIKNPMVIKTTEVLKKLLAEKINVLKEMTALTEKQMKQDTQEYELSLTGLKATRRSYREKLLEEIGSGV